MVLLVGAGLMLRSFGIAAAASIPASQPSNVLTARLQLPTAKYRDDAKRVRFFREAVARLRRCPASSRAGAISYLPLSGLGAGTGFTIVGQPPPPPGQRATSPTSASATTAISSAMNVPLMSGRFFSEREMREKSNVVIVSEALARSATSRTAIRSASAS